MDPSSEITNKQGESILGVHAGATLNLSLKDLVNDF